MGNLLTPFMGYILAYAIIPFLTRNYGCIVKENGKNSHIHLLDLNVFFYRTN